MSTEHVNNMKGKRNILTQRLRIVKEGARGLQNTKFYAILIISAVLAGTLCLSPAISSLMNSVIIGSSGQISISTITAASGSATDIQAAVNWIVAHSGIGNVYIPEGTFNFVSVGEELGTLSGGYYLGPRVTIPAGVNLFGAPTERCANGTVVEWKTILRLPWDAHGTWHYGGCQWFEFVGNGDPNKPSRFSDIKLVGYRSINPDSITAHGAIKNENVVDFRIDHCYFEHTCTGISASGSRGVIDHCFLVNPVSVVGVTLDDCNVFYGVQVSRGSGDLWENDVSKVLGKYTDYTVFIEDCYFEKWRHCVASNDGAHYVIRHSTIKDDFGYGSLDAHGWGTMSGGVITEVGTRAVEIYNCTIIDAIQSPWATFIRGGAGVAFNNTVGGGTYADFIYFSNEAQANVSKCWINDWWIWNNTMLSSMTEIIKYDPLGNINEGVNYFRYAPHTFSYQPYPYPHPLTLETTP